MPTADEIIKRAAALPLDAVLGHVRREKGSHARHRPRRRSPDRLKPRRTLAGNWPEDRLTALLQEYRSFMVSADGDNTPW